SAASIEASVIEDSFEESAPSVYRYLIVILLPGDVGTSDPSIDGRHLPPEPAHFFSVGHRQTGRLIADLLALKDDRVAHQVKILPDVGEFEAELIYASDEREGGPNPRSH